MSTFTWIDHSEKQRRQMLEAIDLFREKDTRDELGIAGIHGQGTEAVLTPCPVVTIEGEAPAIMERDSPGLGPRCAAIVRATRTERRIAHLQD